MYLFTDQKERLLLIALKKPLHTLHEDIVVSHDDNIYSGLERRISDFIVVTGSI
jgi:hypothetical protein